MLARNPLHYGKPLDSSIHRLAHEDPLYVDFEVIEDDKRVIVYGVYV